MSTAVDAGVERAPALPAEVGVAIIGGGFAGLGLAVQLERHGRRDHLVLERADAIGGTWRDNAYPGCACDIPSNLYSFSFAPNPEWSRLFSPQPEIWRYLQDVVDRSGIAPRVRLGHEVLDATWLDAEQRWRVTTNRGTLLARVVVSAMGPLSEPALPDVPGLDRFAGTIMHTSRWDDRVDLAGKRVAVVGTGASAVQVVPRIVDAVGHLAVFQRTAPWVVPRGDRAVTELEKRLWRALPAAQRARRAVSWAARELTVLGLRGNQRMLRLMAGQAARHRDRQVPDPGLRAKLTPDYAIGCKRILLSDDYYPALQRPNAELVTDRITRVTGTGIVTADGAERPVDVIVLGTGFHVTDTAGVDRLHGRGGRSLADVWQGSPQAYLGAEVAGFPNLFLLVGPGTGLGHNSIVHMIESQVRYVLDALCTMRCRGIGSVEVRPDVQAAYNAELQERMQGTVWTAGGCRSWYLDRTGRNTTLWPTSTWQFRLRTRAFRLADHRTVRELDRAPVAVG